MLKLTCSLLISFLISPLLPAQHSHGPGNSRVIPEEAILNFTPNTDIIEPPFLLTNINHQNQNKNLLVLGRKEAKFLSDNEVELFQHIRKHDAQGSYYFPGLVNGDLKIDYSEEGKNHFPLKESDQKEGPITSMELGNPNAYLAHTTSLSHIEWHEYEKEKWRKLGFTSAVTTPHKGILQGQSNWMAMSEDVDMSSHYETLPHQFISLRSNTSGYPGTEMAALAVLRQIFIWNTNTSILPSIKIGEKIIARANSARQIENFIELKKNYGGEREWIILGGKDALKHAEKIKSHNISVIYKMNFKEKPEIFSDDISREYWHFPKEKQKELLRIYEENINMFMQLKKAGVRCALLPPDESKDFKESYEQMLSAGMDANLLLEALSVDLMAILGHSIPLTDFILLDTPPTEEAFPVINSVSSNGSLFIYSKDSDEENLEGINIDGDYLIKTETPMGERKFGVIIERDSKKIELYDPESKEYTSKAKKIRFRKQGVSFAFEPPAMNMEIEVDLKKDSTGWSGTMQTPFGQLDVECIPKEKSLAKETKDSQQEEKNINGHPEYPTDSDDFRRPTSKWATSEEKDLLIQGAMLYPMNGNKTAIKDLLLINGKIADIGSNITAPEGTTIINGKGWHIMPGIIDAHSHLALDSINEGNVTISAECQIQDMIRPQSIGIWRAAAGGTAIVLSLHGSANPIGGQAATWQMDYWEPEISKLVIKEAPKNVKFALGENVKQSNWSSAWGKRFPNSRVGVEAVYQRAFTAAQDYRKKQSLAQEGLWESFNTDVRLEALSNILENKIHIQCHSYRADELLMFLNVCEEYGIKSPTFQHVLEGYKVAPELSTAGAMASTFSDWWAYKYEVQDAIPWNVEIMHKAGVIVSINSDSDEMIRRLNTEAAKAMLYGGLSYEDAMATCTINSAKQLRIEHIVGSLEIGKDATISVFDGPPLSNFSRCLLTLSKGKVLYEASPHIDSRWQSYSKNIKKFISKNSSKSKEETSPITKKQDPKLLKKFTKIGDGLSYYIKNAVIHSGREKPFKGNLLIEDGIIKRISKGIETTPIKANLNVIDAKSKSLYPGFINTLDRTGLVEIESLRATDDSFEIGNNQADLKVSVAIHADSKHHHITRMTGTAYVLTPPGAGRFRGQGALIQLAGTTTEDVVIKDHGMFLTFPRTKKFNQKDGPKKNEAIEELNEWIEACLNYEKEKMVINRNTKIEALIPYLTGKLPLYIEANDAPTLMAAQEWVKEHNLKAVYVSAKEAYKIAGYLGANNAEILFGPVHSLPGRSPQEAFDHPFRSPSLLESAGCKVALFTNDINVTRNLPFQAATAEAWKVDDSFSAINSISLRAAEILDLDAYIGSIEEGKVATFFLCEGNPLENGMPIEEMFIGGKKVLLESHQSQLRDRYLQRLR